ncbi:MAG: hypothetical protein CMC86_01160 [Flavobacteriaceae bacterium]|nr:hypothetical protein [Flavobacteriaceae bacterium]
MVDFKNYWEITQNWQLLFPFVGVLLLVFTSIRLVKLLPINWFNQIDSYYLSHFLIISFFIAIFYLFLKIVIYSILKLENKWIVEERWELIRIFIVFAITGSSSMLISRPVVKLIDSSFKNLSTFVYWFIFIFVSLIFYQILLIFWGWVLGQFEFFWKFEKKMLKRFGLGIFFEKKQ